MGLRTATTRTQLVLLMLAASVSALLTAGLMLTVVEGSRTRAEGARELGVLARLLGSRSSAALVFQDERTAAENLAELRRLPQISRGCLFDDRGRAVATYSLDELSNCVARQPLTGERVEIDGAVIETQVPVLEGDRVVGAMQLQSSAAPLRERLAVQAASLGVALAAAVGLSLLLSLRLHRLISRPISKVREVADTIIERGDTSLRAPDLGGNDIGQLARAFNRMLDTVQQQNRDLAAREDYSRRLFHESRVAQCVFDSTTLHCVDSNVAALELLGHADRDTLFAQGALGGLVPEDLDTHEWRAAVDDLSLRLQQTGSGGVTWALRRPDDSSWEAELDFIVLQVEGRTLWHCSVRDVTAVRAAERARAAQQAAEAANRAKTDFISRMSHELRTPLNAILGVLQLLQRDSSHQLDERGRGNVELARQAGWHLLALIEDVLDIARIESGRLSMSLEPVAVGGVIEAAMALVAGPAAAAGVRLSIEPSALSTGLHAQADAKRLRQVLLNLLSNAIKYNRQSGNVWVRARSTQDRIEIEVADEGAGMSPEQLAHLFEPFNRLGREAEGVPGTGIGLALCRELVSAMQGEIEVSSQAGQGTQVRIRLPQAQSAGPWSMPADTVPAELDTQPQPEDFTDEGVILYIEDNAVNFLLVEQCLFIWPRLRLLHASDGGAGLDLLLHQRPDLVLLDMHLPDMSGIDVLQRMRSEGWLEHSSVIALSASAMPDDVSAAMAAGAVDYWTKPIDLRRFVTQVRTALRRHRARTAPDTV